MREREQRVIRLIDMVGVRKIERQGWTAVLEGLSKVRYESKTDEIRYVTKVLIIKPNGKSVLYGLLRKLELKGLSSSGVYKTVMEDIREVMVDDLERELAINEEDNKSEQLLELGVSTDVSEYVEDLFK